MKEGPVLGRFLNIHEAVKILNEYFITDSVQMVSRWIREGRIKGKRSENRKEGYSILEDDLFDFIEEIRPGLIPMMDMYKSFIEYYPDFQLFKKIHHNDVMSCAPNVLEKHLEIKQNIENHEPELEPSFEKNDDINKLLERKISEIDKEIIELQNNIIQLKKSDNEIKVRIEEDSFIVNKINEKLNGFSNRFDESERNLSVKLNKIEEMLLQQTLNKPTSKKSEVLVDKKIQRITENDFIKLAKEVLSDDYNDHYRESILSYYSKYMNNGGTVKEDLYDGEQYICCPILKGNKSKQLKRILKAAFPVILKEIQEKQIEEEKQLDGVEEKQEIEILPME
jgi:hypothetical protein